MSDAREHARRLLRRERERELRSLNADLLDNYLEHRALYRDLVAECAHRGVAAPEPPEYGAFEPYTPASAAPVYRSTVIRAAPLVSRVEGRMIDALVVPFNRPTRVVDSPLIGGSGEPYLETWLPGSFADQVAAEDLKVWLNFEHQKGIGGVVGHAVELREDRDALRGAIRVHENHDGDKTLELVREGLLSGISIEATPLRTARRGTVVERLAARLKAVALCRDPAYTEARVVAVRDEAPLA